jgi:hypothetical protein
MEATLIVPVIFGKTKSDSDLKEVMKLIEQRDELLNSGWTIKETRLVAFNHEVYAHYVIRKEEENC